MRTERKGVRPIRVLILCTANSARSQMAEGLLRHLGDTAFIVNSAGTNPGSEVHPLAVRAMAEIGIDISGRRPKSLEQFVSEPWDYVITVCDRAKETCPMFPGGRNRLHWSFEDPAVATGEEEERLAVFRRVRDEILGWLQSFVKGTEGSWA